MYTKLYITLLAFFIFSCTIEPEAINYGKDACNYCKMNIVDTQHASEVVTKKGKVYKFDSIECMVNHLKKQDMNTIALFLVSNYGTQDALIDATKATYIKSTEIPSPMGAFLSALKSEQKAKELLDQKGGKLFTWRELLTYQLSVISEQ